MRWTALSSLAVITACASASPPAVDAIHTQGSYGMSMNPSSAVSTATIAQPVEQVWRALPNVYSSLGIPLTTADATTHLIGNEGMKVRRQLGTTPLSRYIECGTTQIGPNADSYDVVITILTQVQPADAGATKLVTTFESSAKPIAFNQEYSHCSSKGLLESRLTDTLNARFKR